MKDDLPDTVGEVIVGKKGYGILVYRADIQSAFHFDYMLWHELGHILSNINNSAIESEAILECHQRKQTALAIGCSVWMEFVADVIALYVTGGRPAPELIDELEDELGYMVSQMVQERFIIPGLLGHYCAYLLMNPTLKMLRRDGKDFPTGLEYARRWQVPDIINIAKLLGTQLEEALFWRISREKMESIGEAMDALWDAS